MTGGLFASILCVLPLLTAAAGAPGARTPAGSDRAARFGVVVAVAGFAVAVVAAVAWATGMVTDGTDALVRLGFGLDGLAVVMLLLVLGLSALIQSYAVRYLRGDARQGWFVVSANLVTSATVLLVSAHTLFAFVAAWMLAGASLILLLATYRTPQARQGVRRTLVQLGIGDTLLVAAAAVIALRAGGDIALDDLDVVARAAPWPLALLIAVCVIAAALARSTQIPFHSWLPATLAVPTPVSALLHAGVVNAGAIVIIRFAPGLGAVAGAMALVFTAGALTVVYAAAVRAVKPDVKGRLVLSTIGQMGFMMMACGLGAFAAAVFHLIGHGLFKATLFLGAGTGVRRAAAQRAWPSRTAPTVGVEVLALIGAVIVPLLAVGGARLLLAPEVSAPTAGLLAFVAFTAAVTFHAALRVHCTWTTFLLGGGSIVVLAVGYTAFLVTFEAVLAPLTADIAQWNVPSPWLLVIPAALMLSLQALTAKGTPAPRLSRALYARALAAAAVGIPVRPSRREEARR